MSPTIASFFLAASLATPTAHLAAREQPNTEWAVSPGIAPRVSTEPFKKLPTKLVMWHGTKFEIAIAPTGADGPPVPEFETMSAIVHWDRLKADRRVGTPAMGGGLVITVTRF